MTKLPIEEAKISPKMLAKDHYFLSLLQAASETGILSASDVSRIELEAVERMAASLRSYTGGESTSVRAELAEAVMSSVLYTAGLALAALPTPDDAAKALRDKPLCALFDAGREKLKAKLFTIQKLGEFLKSNHKKTHSVYYRQAVTKLAARFLKEYEPRFFADNASVFPDYPLALPIQNLIGVEYMQKYMESLYLETRFLLLFEDKKTEFLFHKESPEYATAPQNLFLPVFLSAMTAFLAKGTPRELFLAYDAAAIRHLYQGKDETALLSLFRGALPLFFAALSESNRSLFQYAEACIPSLAASIFAALRTENPALAFPTLRETPVEAKAFRFGRRMDDDRYSGVLYQVENADSFAERAIIIREKIHSLYDLEDILRDHLFSESEILTFLRPLSESELAFLYKKHPPAENGDAAYRNENELSFAHAVQAAMDERSPASRTTIEELSLLISDDVFEL